MTGTNSISQNDNFDNNNYIQNSENYSVKSDENLKRSVKEPDKYKSKDNWRYMIIQNHFPNSLMTGYKGNFRIVTACLSAKFDSITNQYMEMSINVQSKFTQNSETALILQPA